MKKLYKSLLLDTIKINTLKIYHSLEEYDNTQRSCVTIGTFDGVHTGHKKVIDNLVATAKSKKALSVVLTFFPHPRMVVQKSSDFHLINTIKERIELLSKTKLDILIIQKFTKKLSQQSALFFVRNILVNKLHLIHLIVGHDHRFGRNREGNFEQLQEYGHTYDFLVSKISKREIGEIAVSSTKIRTAILKGDIQRANTYLGYYFSICGTVVSGKKIGSRIGFPTANISIFEKYKIIPKTGVYVVRSYMKNEYVLGMMNIGHRPTVNGKNQTIEVHFFDISDNLYQKQITIEVLHFLRDEQKFDSLESLKQQLYKDKQQALLFKK